MTDRAREIAHKHVYCRVVDDGPHMLACDALTDDIDNLLVLEGEGLRRGKPPLLMVPADFDPGQIDPPGIITYKHDDGWRAIDSAPLRQRVLVGCVDSDLVVQSTLHKHDEPLCDGSYYGWDNTAEDWTHWRPLPEPPQ